MTTFNVLDIVPGTSVDGPGLRTSIYFAGCAHECPGCHNRDSWDFEQGRSMTVGDIMEIVTENGFDVTFSGGDPIYQLPLLKDLAEVIKSEGFGIWLYTGFLFEQLTAMPSAKDLLPYIDVVVDGPFIESLRDIGLRFRGSSNQRIVDVRRSLDSASVVQADEFAGGIGTSYLRQLN